MENVEERVLDIRVRYDDAIRKIAEYRTQLDVLQKVEKTIQHHLHYKMIDHKLLTYNYRAILHFDKNNSYSFQA